MKFGPRSALGIDISENRISMALLKKDGGGIKLLRSASGSVPAGAIKDGCIENAALLTKAVRKLKNSVTIRPVQTAVSLFAEPTVMQIMDIPTKVPSNVGKFIQEQVKHFAVLLGKRIALDFFGVGSETGSAGRVLTVATDSQRVDELVKMYSRAGIAVEVIEPPLLACIAALYAEKIEGRFDSNVLIAVLRDNSLTLCVFKKHTMDFVRTREISEGMAGPDKIYQWLAGQMNTVIQSYDIEAPLGCANWEITIVADNIELPADAQEVLKANVARTNLQLLRSEDICQAAAIGQSRRIANCDPADKPSLAAVGLAMKLLDGNVCNLGVNLLPAKTVRLKAAQKRTLIAANVIAAVLLVMVLAIGVPIRKINKLNESIEQKKTHLTQSTRSLVEERELIKEQTKTVDDRFNGINKILDSHRDVYWPGLLSDIAKKRPKAVLITGLTSGDNSQASLKGLAISNEDVYLFMEMLNKSEYIDEAAIVETKKDSNHNGLVSYEIRCSLTARKGV
ncbi:MAG: pilus assembly protein PilM [Phycisphaerales bacterium]|jgi:Tfp pilus assembly protein PilN